MLLEKMGRTYTIKVGSFYDELKTRKQQLQQSSVFFKSSSAAGAARDGVVDDKNASQQELPPYPTFQEWAVRCPPDGSKIRSQIEEASHSGRTLTCVSDYDRWKREIQSVTCHSGFSFDHSFDLVKNYPRSLGAKAVFNVARNTGEIASTVLVESTKISQAAHAAECLARRPDFRPKVYYSDIFPHGKKFWDLLFGPSLKGRLGLFHYMQRIVKTLRDSHIDYGAALRDLRAAIYTYHPDDEARLIVALKQGLLGGKKLTNNEIAALQSSKLWSQRYACRLRKIIHQGEVISVNLAKWHNEYKVEASPGNPLGKGRLDPTTFKKLFTPDGLIPMQIQVAALIKYEDSSLEKTKTRPRMNLRAVMRGVPKRVPH